MKIADLFADIVPQIDTGKMNSTLDAAGHAGGTTLAAGVQSGVEKGKSGIASSVSSSGKAFTASFSSIAGVLKQQTSSAFAPLLEVGEGLNAAKEAIEKNGKSIGGVMTGLGTGAAVAGGILLSVGSQEKQATDQLKQSIENAGGSYEDYEKQIEATVKSQEKFGHTASETKGALQVLTDATGDPKKALADMGEAANLAASKHESLQTASEQLAKIMSGKGGKILASYGIQMKDASGKTKDMTEVQKELAEKLDGQAAASTDNFNGKIRGLTAAVEDQVGAFGEKYGPAIAGAGTAVGALGSGISGVQKVMGLMKGASEAAAAAQEGLTAATEAGTGAQEGLNVAEEANPIGLIVLAVVGLIAVIVLIATKTTWFQDIWTSTWGFVSTAVTKAIGIVTTVVTTVFKWFEEHWPLLLAILTGPFGLAVLFIVDHFNQILDFVRAIPGKLEAIGAKIWTWITDFLTIEETGLKDIWGKITTFVTGIPGKVKAVGTAIWTWVTDLLHTEETGLQVIWGRIVGFVTGLGGKISGAATGMWDGIKNAFKDAINWIIGKWNGLQFSIPGVNTHIPGVGTVGGFTLGTPDIPYLAGGGLLNGPGSATSDSILAALSNGEFVVNARATANNLPALRSINSGGSAGISDAQVDRIVAASKRNASFHVETVNVNDGADADLFFSKARAQTTAYGI